LLKRLAPVAVANTWAGFYTAAQSIARIPYFLMVTATLVLFPVIAALHGRDEGTRVKREEATTRALTMILTLLVGMAATTVPIAGKLVVVLYPARYAEAGGILAWLIVGLCALTLVSVVVTMISGGGRPLVSAFFLGMALTLQVGLAYFLIPRFGAQGAAMATTGAATFTFLAGFQWIRATYATRVPAWSLGVTALMGGGVTALSWAFGAFFPEAGKLVTVVFCALAFGLYLALCALGGVLFGVLPRRRRTLWVTKALDPPFNDGSKVMPRAILAHFEPDALAICVAGKPQPGAWPEGLEVARVYSRANSFVGRHLQNARVFAFLLVSRFHYKNLHFFFAPNPMTCSVIRFLKAITPGVRFIQTVMSRPQSFEGSGSLLFGHTVIAQSEATRQALMAHSDRDDVRLIRPAIDVDAFELVENKGREDAAKTLLFAGDIDHGGALPHLAEILPPLLEGQADLRVIFSVRRKGPGSQARAEAFFEEHLARFTDRVVMHIDHPDFDDLLQEQDAMIFPAENLYTKIDAPLVILETLARGKPVFLLNRPPLDEIYPEELNAQLVGDDAAALVEKVEDWLRHPDSLDPHELRRVVKHRYSAAAAAEELRGLY
jgi:glycosyltransferase involved in cell wall biosynthesis